jgi:IS30 family transposase
MPNALTYAVEPGGLSASDHERIHELHERGWKSTRIARALRKHPSTVQWFMYRNGLKAPEYRDAKPYTRNGRQVVPFSPDEDLFIEAKRTEGIGPRAIAKAADREFGTNRNHHTIACRLVMLAAREVAA